jgi:thiamine biosynthesis lipoprotein
MATISLQGRGAASHELRQEIHAADFQALGTTATVEVARRARLGDAIAAVQKTVAAFDRACSRFRPLLLEAVAAALRAAMLTDGAVDPTVGSALITLGYDRDYAALLATPRRDGPSRRTFKKVPGWRAVSLDMDAGTVRLQRGVKLDLGATAKALAADRAAAAAAEAGECEVLVSLGGDIATAGAPDGGWPVRVTDDHRDGAQAPGQWIALAGGGLATSSTTARRWRMPWGSAHHLVDPATGAPAAGPWRTATVAAASCLDANVASTAAVVRGERAEGWLRSLGLPSRLVGTDGRACHIAGWPGEGDDLG